MYNMKCYKIFLSFSLTNNLTIIYSVKNVIVELDTIVCPLKDDFNVAKTFYLKKICFKHFENVILMHHLEQECNLRHFSFLVNKKTRVNDKIIFQFLDKVTFLELQ
jgi:hypothetical protein